MIKIKSGQILCDHFLAFKVPQDNLFTSWLPNNLHPQCQGSNSRVRLCPGASVGYHPSAELMWAVVTLCSATVDWVWPWHWSARPSSPAAVVTRPLLLPTATFCCWCCCSARITDNSSDAARRARHSTTTPCVLLLLLLTIAQQHCVTAVALMV